MSGNLSAFELLHRENLFIRLKNQGKNLDEIAMLLDVEKELVEKWNEGFEKEIKSLNSQNIPIKFSIVQKTEESEYIKHQSFSLKLSNLDKIIFDLQKIRMANIDNLTPSQKEFIEKLQIDAKVYVEVLEKYVNEVEFEEQEDNGINFSFWQKKDLEDDKNNDIIGKALMFWARYCYTSEKRQYESLLIKEMIPDYVKKDNSYLVLPCAIKQLKIQNYHSIANIHLENLNIDAQWIFLFGENGFGKTSILQAIVLSLLSNSKEVENIDIEQTTKIGIEFINNYISRINNLHNVTHYSIENLVCYGSSRLNMGGENTNEDESKKSGLTYSLFHTDGMLLNIEKYLREWFLAKDERFEKVIEAFKIIIPYLHDIQVIRDEKTREFEVRYFEKELTENGESGASFQKVSFNHLAAGLKSVLAMVGDMFIRLYRTQPSVTNPSELVGIAIIDELELHLHPKWQIKLPQLLSTVFPKVQFIVSTHSAIPLLGATPNAVFIKVTRDKENGIQAQKMDIDLKNLTPNQLFYFLFDMESITSVNNTNLSEVRTEDTKAEFLKNDEVKRRFKAFETQKAATDFPDDLFEPENSAAK